MLKDGKFLEGMEKFFDQNVSICEVGQEPKVGKAHRIAVEEDLLSEVSEFIQYTAHSAGSDGKDKTFYEATMEFKTKDGQHVKQDQAVVTTWANGLIIDEKYYHPNA
ncbi:conserved hypothetical protein [Roseibium sp. TrichSKD4]|uniref:hypothetical protein n=1 Tax=Roseibium sp. TrichSKD4 TaxID=744980 RepID=UPI0001E56957|nr:hypothetical protein [Roseibium sp. TrichSKD4]EFO31829.1 conserved hypothetical protein [Roseibium sp. TrichSKD4]